MKKGFTLIELLVVVLIIGILASLALPQYQKAVLKSRTAQCVLTLHAVDTAQEVYWLANGTYGLDEAALGLPDNFCYLSANTIVCNSTCMTATKNRLLMEWLGSPVAHVKFLACGALTGDSAANEICRQYQRDWGGTSAGNERDNGYTYYVGPEIHY